MVVIQIHSSLSLFFIFFTLDHDHLARLLLAKYNANRDAKNIHDQVPFDLVSDQDDPKWNGIFYMDPVSCGKKKKKIEYYAKWGIFLILFFFLPSLQIAILQRQKSPPATTSQSSTTIRAKSAVDDLPKVKSKANERHNVLFMISTWLYLMQAPLWLIFLTVSAKTLTTRKYWLKKYKYK